MAECQAAWFVTLKEFQLKRKEKKEFKPFIYSKQALSAIIHYISYAWQEVCYLLVGPKCLQTYLGENSL